MSCCVTAEQDFTSQLKLAAATYERNPENLRRLTRQLRHPASSDLCRQSAKELLKHEPQSLDAIASLIFGYIYNNNRLGFRNSIDLAQERANGDKKILDKIYKKIHADLDDRGRKNLAKKLGDYSDDADQIATRKAINLEAQQRFLQRPEAIPNTCDVITIASNEGPYIAEFIHHYLFQGFSNIFIGLNNDSSGHTGPIIEAISRHYPQVQLINTDVEHSEGLQRGSYSKLYDTASKTTSSSHCMVVDVDESWVAYPLESKIGDFLAAHADADVVSSNWLHCHGGNLFDNPLDLSNTKLRLTDQFKSLFRYGLAITDLGAHVPWVLATAKINHICSDGQPVHSPATNGLRRLRKSGIQADTKTTNTGWVIHRHTRSEIEYASKLLYPDANKQTIPFKQNRKGYELPEEKSVSRKLATRLFGPEHQPPQDYRNSLENFIAECGVHKLITTARKDIREATIRRRIRAMNKAVIQKNRKIWKHTFRGTRFLAMLEKRCRPRRGQRET